MFDSIRFMEIINSRAKQIFLAVVTILFIAIAISTVTAAEKPLPTTGDGWYLNLDWDHEIPTQLYHDLLALPWMMEDKGRVLIFLPFWLLLLVTSPAPIYWYYVSLKEKAAMPTGIRRRMACRECGTCHRRGARCPRCDFVLCSKCGYNLRVHKRGNKCPECGNTINV